MSASSLLWNLKLPGGRQSWLFGTMHVRDERVYQFCHALYPIILSTDVYVGEMDLSHPRPRYEGADYDLRAQYSPRTLQKIRNQILKSFDLDITPLSRLHPLLILTAITQRVLEAEHTVSLDEHLWNFAGEHSLQLRGLETAEEQIRLLNALDPLPLYRQIKSVASRPSSIRKFTEKALKLYTREDIHQLYKLTKSSMHHLRKQVIYQRNALMLARISGYDISKSYFITVGAGHLSGKHGLITGLRKNGWKVTPHHLR